MKQNLGKQVHHLSRLMKKSLDASPAKSCMDHLTGVHGWIIGYLYHHRERDTFQRDLENELGMSRSTATTVLQLMEKNELLTRHGVPYDARLKKLVLTDKAVGLLQTFEADCERLDEAVMEGISPEEREQFMKLCGIMISNLEKMEHARSGKEAQEP